MNFRPNISPKNELINSLQQKNTDFHCLIDIDSFSTFNRKHGFERGNEILSKIYDSLKRIINPDSLAYLGSDEFYFSTDKNWSNPNSPVFYFMQSIKNELDITVSIGITQNSKLKQPDEIMSLLKSNVLQAKSNGKNLIYCL